MTKNLIRSGGLERVEFFQSASKLIQHIFFRLEIKLLQCMALCGLLWLISQELVLHNTSEGELPARSFPLQWRLASLVLRWPISKLSGINMSNLSRKVSSTGCDLQLSRLQLVSWPSRLDLFQEDLPDIIRICALLARRPSVGILIPVLLEMSPKVTYSLLKILYAKGCIRPVGGAVAPELATLPEADSEQDRQLATPLASFLNKVWQHLTEKSTLWGAEGGTQAGN